MLGAHFPSKGSYITESVMHIRPTVSFPAANFVTWWQENWELNLWSL